MKKPWLAGPQITPAALNTVIEITKDPIKAVLVYWLTFWHKLMIDQSFLSKKAISITLIFGFDFWAFFGLGDFGEISIASVSGFYWKSPCFIAWPRNSGSSLIFSRMFCMYWLDVPSGQCLTALVPSWCTLSTSQDPFVKIVWRISLFMSNLSAIICTVSLQSVCTMVSTYSMFLSVFCYGRSFRFWFIFHFFMVILKVLVSFSNSCTWHGAHSIYIL